MRPDFDLALIPLAGLNKYASHTKDQGEKDIGVAVML